MGDEDTEWTPTEFYDHYEVERYRDDVFLSLTTDDDPDILNVLSFSPQDAITLGEALVRAGSLEIETEEN